MTEPEIMASAGQGEPSGPAAQNTGLLVLLMMAQFHGLQADAVKLQHEFGAQPFDVVTLLNAAKAIGFTAKQVRQSPERLDKAPLPCIALDTEGRFFVLAKVDTTGASGAVAPAPTSTSTPTPAPASASASTPTPASASASASASTPPLTPASTSASLLAPVGPAGAVPEAAVPGLKLLIQRPGEPPQVLGWLAFEAIWSGQLIYLTSKANFAAAAAHFDFTWFIPAIVKYRRLLGEVFLLSLVLQLVALVTPLFFQVVMDKVLVNHAMQTLHIIALGLLCATVFEALLTGIRTYVFAHTSSKIDVELGARLFRHLLALPLAYFQSRRTGDSVARVRELENIRSFLTGHALTLVLDLMFSFVFVAVLLWYSAQLTLIVLASIPVYILISIVFTPLLRARLNEKFNRGAENQSFLVETIGGIDTVKAMAVEPRWQQRWDKQLASYVAAGLSATNVGTVAGNAVMLVSKLVTLGIMWLGAQLVLEGKLSVGQLIAFNMLAGQVSNPILRMAQLWNEFQQVGISMSRLGDILNTRTEIEGSKTRIPHLAGAIEFDQVSFRYRPDAPDVIRAMQLSIRPGEVIGIVGRSGSGKSTLAKLIQRMYVPDRGRVLIDGQDIAIIDTASLRHQIGVVLQENVLFNRPVRENIALSNPALSIEAITEAARLAGAHEFICELPEGYDTLVGEHGVGLSGGQRQRVAIARALIGNPRILIFDEATSALDYESERIIQDNMRRISAGRTVIIIAHRLSAVRDAGRIIVLERGQIAEQGSHPQLLANAQGIYSHLYRLQGGLAA